MSTRGMEGGFDAAASLPRLTSETELQKMLADERMRSEQHKNNYQALKSEHTRLQDEYLNLQTELKSTIEESKLIQEKYKVLLEQVRVELMNKHQECEDLRTQVVTEQKLEVIKLQVTEEVEKPFRHKMTQLSEENDNYRTEFNKIKYEYSFLKAEYEHERNEHQQIVEELRLRHEAEVTNLRKERETILARSQSDPNAESQRARTLQRENAQLHLKVKGLLNELEEIRAQREHQGLQSDHVTRLQSKQLAEHAANVKALETERESLKLQYENLQRELSMTTDLHTALTSKVHELEKDNLILKNHAEEVSHKSKVDLTTVKMDMLKERGDLERERDKLRNEIEELKSQVDIAQCSLEAQSDALVDKEKEAARRVQAALETEWSKLTKIENEKMELETKLQETERRKIDEETRAQAQREAAEEKVKQAMEAKDEAEKDALVYKTKLQHHESLMDQMERERAENADLKIRLHRLESEVHTYMTHERELLDHNQKLKNQLDHAMEDLKTTKDSLACSQKETDRVVSEHRVTFAEEKINMQKRVEEQDEQLSELHQRLAMTSTMHKKKKRRYAKIVAKLKDKLSLTSAKMEELEIERDALKRSVPTDQHHKLKKQLNDLLRRHREFRSLLTCSGPGATLDLSGGSAQLDCQTGFFPDGLDLHAEKELELIKERLDNLGDNQRQQMDELRTITKMVSPIADLDKDDDQEKEEVTA